MVEPSFPEFSSAQTLTHNERISPMLSDQKQSQGTARPPILIQFPRANCGIITWPLSRERVPTCPRCRNSPILTGKRIIRWKSGNNVVSSIVDPAPITQIDSFLRFLPLVKYTGPPAFFLLLFRLGPDFFLVFSPKALLSVGDGTDCGN